MNAQDIGKEKLGPLQGLLFAIIAHVGNVANCISHDDYRLDPQDREALRKDLSETIKNQIEVEYLVRAFSTMPLKMSWQRPQGDLLVEFSSDLALFYSAEKEAWWPLIIGSRDEEGRPGTLLCIGDEEEPEEETPNNDA